MDVYMPDGLLQLYLTGKSRKYRIVERNRELLTGFLRTVELMMLAESTSELKNYSYLHYERLKHKYTGYSSVRLSNRSVHRLIFKEYDYGIRVELIDIDDTHYGNKH